MPQATHVRDIMSKPVVTINEDAPLAEAAKAMQSYNIGALPVTDTAGRLVGMVTEADFTGVARCVPFTLELAPVIFGFKAATPAELLKIYEEARKLPVRQAMSDKPIAVREDDPIGKVVKLLLDKKIKHVPVVDAGNVPIGMVARHDLLRMMAGS
jgi:CBS domain-containing protein